MKITHCQDGKNFMRRILIFTLCSIVFATVGFFFLPAATRGTVALFFTSLVNATRDPSPAQSLPLLAIDNGVNDDRNADASATSSGDLQSEWRTVYGELAPAMSLEQAISFQMTIQNILKNWPQVSTGIKEDGLFGYRVPLVSGTGESDVTGALTYFFGSDRVLYRIDFKGDTGDARKLVLHLTQNFQMERRTSAEQGVYLYQTPGEVQAVGELRICPRTIIHNAHPHQRFELSLQLSRFYSDDIEL
tara:strand:- start:43 stop:783 length:741 start_codon:yes stop_codon:yes gene_type:complete